MVISRLSCPTSSSSWWYFRQKRIYQPNIGVRTWATCNTVGSELHVPPCTATGALLATTPHCRWASTQCQQRCHHPYGKEHVVGSALMTFHVRASTWASLSSWKNRCSSSPLSCCSRSSYMCNKAWNRFNSRSVSVVLCPLSCKYLPVCIHNIDWFDISWKKINGNNQYFIRIWYQNFIRIGFN